MKIDFEKLDTPFLIGEIGINHNGDFNNVKKLTDGAFAANWDCVKFQKRNPDVCVPENQKAIERNTPWGKMTYLQYKYKIEFGQEEYNKIDNYCKEKPISWTASVWDLDSLEFILGYDVPFLKIPSALLTNIELIKEVARSGKTLMVSTGMSTIEEIDKSFNTILKYGDVPILMHTNSSYPTPTKELNLNLIPFLKERYKCVVGYSGHEQNLTPSVVAVVLGAQIVERHITLSHNMWGTDQKSSLEFLAMDMLAKRIKDIKLMLGDGEKRVTESEIPIREKLRRI
ncbi:MAG: N-acetylneuraminate synthase [Bacteroidetes bacterium]|nr:N-acetylneuraminate synthase [Bacteroidota bacterium]